MDQISAQSLDTLSQMSLGGVLREEHYETLEELMEINHHLLASLDVSHPALERVISSARRTGFKGAKLTGAGGGGCAIVLLPPEKGDESALVEALELEGFKCWRAKLGGKGVTYCDEITSC